jgi:hypothetical protein
MIGSSLELIIVGMVMLILSSMEVVESLFVVDDIIV